MFLDPSPFWSFLDLLDVVPWLRDPVPLHLHFRPLHLLPHCLHHLHHPEPSIIKRCFKAVCLNSLRHRNSRHRQSGQFGLTCSQSLISSSDAALSSHILSILQWAKSPKGNCGRSHEMVVQLSFQPFTLSNRWYRPNFAPVLITPRRPNKAFLRWLNMLNPSEPRDSWHETWKKIAWSTYTHVNLELHVVKNTSVTRRRMEKGKAPEQSRKSPPPRHPPGIARPSLWSKIQLRSSVRKRSCTSSRDWLLMRHRWQLGLDLKMLG